MKRLTSRNNLQIFFEFTNFIIKVFRWTFRCNAWGKKIQSVLFNYANLAGLNIELETSLSDVSKCMNFGLSKCTN